MGLADVIAALSGAARRLQRPQPEHPLLRPSERHCGQDGNKNLPLPFRWWWAESHEGRPGELARHKRQDLGRLRPVELRPQRREQHLWCSWPVTIFPNGAMYRNSQTRVANVTDGLSNTVFAGERSSNLADSVWAGVVPFSEHFQYPPFLSIGSGGINRPYDGPGAFVCAHGGPCPYEDPVVIHPPTVRWVTATRWNPCTPAGPTS